MTKKHYKAIAQVIKDNTTLTNEVKLYKLDLISDLCKYFKKDNNRFDCDRFISACD